MPAWPVTPHHAPARRFLGLSEPNIKFDPFRLFRNTFTGTVMANGGISIEAGKPADAYAG